MKRFLGRGALLLGLEQWRRACFGPDFILSEGQPELAGLVAGVASPRLLDYFDDQSRRVLQEVVAGLGPDGTHARYLTTARGTPLEVLVVDREGDGFEAFFRTAENRLQTMEGLVFFYRMFLAGPTAVCFTDPKGTILDVNRGFLDLYGYQLGEVIGQNPRLIKSGRQSPAAYEAMWKALADDSVGHWTGEVINRRKDGSEVTVLLTVTSVREVAGRVIGYVGNAIDITRRKQMEQELTAKNRELESLNALKSDLMAITSHDLKAPLNAISSYGHLLRDSLGQASPERARDLVGRILLSVRRMADMIDCILDLDRIGHGAYALDARRLHLDEVLRTCIETSQVTAADKGVAIRYQAIGVPSPVVADLVKMEQLFNNVLSNAVKFSDPGSEVEVTYEDLGAVKRITVADRGPGIPPEDLESIFDRYYQVKRKGSLTPRGLGGGVGLGLAIARSIVETHGGSIRAENRPGGGCAFAIELPARTLGAPGRGLAAMIIDPKGAVTPFLDAPLKRKGVDVFVVRGVEDAGRVVGFEDPDLVFLQEAGLGAELLELVECHARIRRPRPLVISLDETRASSRFRSLLLPVAEVEVLEIVRELEMATARA